jgi:hypothetical protein
MQALDVSGVLDRQTFKEAYPEINSIRPGQTLWIPQFNKAAAFARVNVVSGISTPATFTQISSSDQNFPVLRDTSDNFYTRYDVRYQAEKQRVALETTIAERMAERILTQLGNVLSGAIPAITPTHVLDITGQTLSTLSLLAAKSLLQDQFYKLDTLICRPEVYQDLVGEWITKLRFNPVTGIVAVTGELQNVIGIKNIIVTNQMPSPQSGSTGYGQYTSFLVGSDSLFFGWQNENDLEAPIVESMDNYLINQVTQNLIRFNLDYILAPRGMKFTGAVNPTDVQLATSSNWAQANEDHRNCLIVKIISEGEGGKTATFGTTA